jgi:hypothetical protein
LASLHNPNERKIEPVIPSETIEQIAAANDIVEVIGSYFPLKRAADFSLLWVWGWWKRLPVRHGV